MFCWAGAEFNFAIALMRMKLMNRVWWKFNETRFLVSRDLTFNKTFDYNFFMLNIDELSTVSLNRFTRLAGDAIGLATIFYVSNAKKKHV